ncbi:Y-family DNA polymerase [Cellulosimicrobium arenosum]|uniref:DNA polymerase Y family protein n=1 Tax=Cellulosimicrobium arenosum TaxID=2708133 RepID=A0A927G5U2_9MICO|nr:DNA polymerase Y family protein [Cellulosimicrobium arenosum]MBD8077626.1 DNA polymerase Y family protein [Cellulosimicrobium arenosum]
MTTRTAALWVPDWPVLAAMAVRDIPAHVPAATHDGRRVVAVSATARAHGVRRGMRRRRARECCPDLELLDVDDARDAREFEPVALAAETVVAGLEITRPGLLLLPAVGASRYHGSDEALARALVTRVVERTGHECQVGVADGILAAVLAARESVVVAREGSAAFLGPRPARDLVHVAARPDVVTALDALVGLLDRLGVRTLGALAALPPATVEGRFGALGAWAHRLARGEDLRPPARRRVEQDVAVQADLDPPAERVDVATFAARRLAEDLHDQLVTRSLVAGRLRITARTVEGDDLERTWRLDGPAGGLSPARITDRVRWQLEGWLTTSSVQAARAARGRTGRRRAVGGVSPGGTAEVPGVAPLAHLALTAEEVVAAGAQQPRLWGASSGEDQRAHRALSRVQGLLGGDAVLQVATQGGRDVTDRVHLVPFGEDVVRPRDPAQPWPGSLPSPAPAVVLDPPPDAVVLDAAGRPVVVDARLAMSGDPATVRWAGDAGDGDAGRRGAGTGGAGTVGGWAGPWPLAERWWTTTPRRRVHLQVVLDDGRGLLLASTRGRWTVEGVYD